MLRLYVYFNRGIQLTIATAPNSTRGALDMPVKGNQLFCDLQRHCCLEGSKLPFGIYILIRVRKLGLLS